MLVFCAKTIVRESCKFELARLKKKKKKKEKHFGRLVTFWFSTLAMLLAPLGVLFVMKTHEDERYCVITAYKLAVLKILRNLFVLAYFACPRYPYI